MNIVELAASAEGDETAFDQPCRFGHRVEGHAVYCHNDLWDDSPRKCRRTWYTGGEIKDEECPGFEPNEEYQGALVQIPIPNPCCSKCKGTRRINADKGKYETCPLCQGSGEKIKPIELTKYEQDTLQRGHCIGRGCSQDGHSFVRITENDGEFESIVKLDEMGLVVIKSFSFLNGGSAALLETTAKGNAVMMANLKAKEE